MIRTTLLVVVIVIIAGCSTQQVAKSTTRLLDQEARGMFDQHRTRERAEVEYHEAVKNAEEVYKRAVERNAQELSRDHQRAVARFRSSENSSERLPENTREQALAIARARLQQDIRDAESRYEVNNHRATERREETIVRAAERVGKRVDASERRTRDAQSRILETEIRRSILGLGR